MDMNTNTKILKMSAFSYFVVNCIIAIIFYILLIIFNTLVTLTPSFVLPSYF